MEKPIGALGFGAGYATTRITTAGLPESERFAFWHASFNSSLYKFDCPPTTNRDFFGKFEVTRVKETKFSYAHCRGFKSLSKPHFVRQGSGIGHEQEDEIFVHLLLRGRLAIMQDGRQAVLGPGDLACFDSTRYESGIGSNEVEQLILHIPRETWIRRLGPTEKLTARIVRGDTYMGGLVSNFLRQIVPGIGAVDLTTADRLRDVSLDLVTTAFGSLIGEERIFQSSGRLSLLYRAKAVIEENLGNPVLNPEMISRELGISERYLQDLFHDENTTVCNWMWQRRLEKCRQDLSDRVFAGIGVSQIAFNYGFNSLSHFSRRFKAAFSITPSEFRHVQLVGSRSTK